MPPGRKPQFGKTSWSTAKPGHVEIPVHSVAPVCPSVMQSTPFAPASAPPAVDALDEEPDDPVPPSVPVPPSDGNDPQPKSTTSPARYAAARAPSVR